MDKHEVKDPELWRRIQFSFLEAMGIFVFTILIGIVNAVDLVEFTRAELLFHLHSGTLGWISLSAITLLVWYFTGGRELKKKTKVMANSLLKYVQIIIPVYVVFFYIVYSLANDNDLFRLISLGEGGSGYFVLLLFGGIFMTLGFIWTAYFGITELRQLDVKTTPHYLFLGAVLTASYGGIFGTILEIQHLIQDNLFDPAKGQDGTAAHAAAMEAGYLFMIIAAILEWQILDDSAAKIDLWGYVEVGGLFFAGFTVAFGAGFNLLPLVMLNLPLLLIGVITFIIRVAIKIDPKSIIGDGINRFHIPSVFFMLLSVTFFLYTITQIIGGKDIIDLFSSPLFGNMLLANNHALFIGGMTSAIFGSISLLYSESEENKLIETIGFVLIFVGLAGFITTLILRGYYQENLDPRAADVRTDIASVMGFGLFMIMYAFFSRYRKLTSQNGNKD